MIWAIPIQMAEPSVGATPSLDEGGFSGGALVGIIVVVVVVLAVLAFGIVVLLRRRGSPADGG